MLVLLIGCKPTTKKNNGTENIDNYTAQLDSLLDTKNPRKFNGVIRIVKNGETKYQKAHGYADFEKKTPLAFTDNFRIQSNSKQITAVLILKQVEQGNIDLDQPIRTYLPQFAQSWADSVTVHQMLNMSAGILDENEPLLFEPGTDFKYSNPAYGMLGQIFEAVSGKTYIAAANDMFNELKMKNTFCYELGKYPNRVLNGYVNTANEFEFFDFYSDVVGFTEEGWKKFVPAGGIISNLEDLHIWDTNLHNGKILNEETYELMTTYSITAKHAAYGDEKVGYGYGLRIRDKDMIKDIGHAGKGLGFISIKIYIPEKKVSVIVLENQYSRNSDIVYHFQKEVRAIVLNSSLVK